MDTILQTAAPREALLARAAASVRRSVGATVNTIGVWRERARARRRLATLDDRMLRDIGVDRAAIWQEVQKPFYRP